MRIAELEESESDHKQAEEALRESEENYRNLFENANEAIFIAENGKMVFLNPITTIISGYSTEELIGKPFIEFIHLDDRDKVSLKTVSGLLRHKNLRTTEIYLHHLDPSHKEAISKMDDKFTSKNEDPQA
ncbi:MAG TPA: PAS domain S-box protein [Syntrophales bacterium]